MTASTCRAGSLSLGLGVGLVMGAAGLITGGAALAGARKTARP
jgi:hypothetical protein